MEELTLQPPPPAAKVLTSWKDIANHLGKSVRTAQRWERYLGLPVRRPTRRPWGIVLATVAELDDWVAQQLSVRRDARPAAAEEPRRCSQCEALKARVEFLAARCRQLDPSLPAAAMPLALETRRNRRYAS